MASTKSCSIAVALACLAIAGSFSFLINEFFNGGVEGGLYVFGKFAFVIGVLGVAFALTINQYSLLDAKSE